ncbi:MAG: PEP-CTERM sorting domain-containing protein [Verrucomicrobiota bacterium]
MKRITMLFGMLSLGLSANADVNINWQTFAGGMLHWESPFPPTNPATDVLNSAGAIWLLLWDQSGAGIDPVGGDPSLPTGDDVLLLTDNIATGPGFNRSDSNITSGLDSGGGGVSVPTTGVLDIYVRVVNTTPANTAAPFSYFDPSLVGGSATSVSAFDPLGGGPPVIPTDVDINLGQSFQQMVLIPEPSTYALFGMGAFLLFLRRKSSRE